MIKEQRNNDAVEKNFSTGRSTVEAMEKILYKPIPVLDYGFIRVIDYMGDDSSIVQAARVSYGKGTKKISQDKGLINYLMRHAHTTPFEMCEIKFHIKLPIFIARQWVRHRTASINEYSARYSVLDKEFYIPSREDLAAQSSSNKQGREDFLSEAESNEVLNFLNTDSKNCYEHYIKMLNISEKTGEPLDKNKKGLTRELARMNLTLNYYTQWYWKIDLHNLLHFLRLRADSHAQFEIREYAIAMLDILKKWVPYTYEAFLNYKLNSVNLSCNAWQVVKSMLSGKKIKQKDSGVSKREWDELMEQLQ